MTDSATDPNKLRVVSLISSATEIVAALGCEHLLVGRSHECDFPATVRSLPICSEPCLDINARSKVIDEQVKTRLASALSIYKVFPQVLEELQPTHILTQTQCEVCAVSLSDVEDALCQTIGNHAELISLSPMNLSDIWTTIQTVGDALGCSSRAEILVAELVNRLETLKKKTKTLPHPSVVCIEWIEPLMVAGNWVPELVEFAGGTNLLGKAGQHSPWLNWNELLEADPDIIVVLPCGFNITRTHQEMSALKNDSRWKSLRAVRSGQIVLADGNQFFNRPGPRMIESAEILAEILHPNECTFHHAGTAWVRFPAD